MAKYFDYNNIFLSKNVAKLLKYIRINKNNIKLKKNKQLLFRLNIQLKANKM